MQVPVVWQLHELHLTVTLGSKVIKLLPDLCWCQAASLTQAQPSRSVTWTAALSLLRLLLLLLSLLLPASTSWRHRTTPSAATTLAYCFTRVGLMRILLPRGRGVVSTCM